MSYGPPPASGTVPFTTDFCTRQCFCWTEGRPQGLELHDVYAPSLDDVWAVGVATLMRFDGAQWSRAVIEEDLAVVSIAGRGHDDIWAVASDGSVFLWDGERLERRPDVAPVPLTTVDVAPDGTVWLAGADGYVARGREAFEEVDVGSATIRVLYAVDADTAWLASSQDVFRVENGVVAMTLDGVAGTRAIAPGPDGAVRIARATTILDVRPEEDATSELPFALRAACAGSDGVWYAAESSPGSGLDARAAVWRDDGTGWTRLDEEAPPLMTGVACGADTLFRYGSYGQLVAGSGNARQVLTHEGPRTPRALVASTSTGQAPTFASSPAGTLLQRDAGEWTALEDERECPDWVRGGARLWAAPGGEDGWLLFEDGSVFRIEGDEITRAPALPSVERPLDVHGAGADAVFVVGYGGRIDRFDGERWTPIESPLPGTIERVWARSADDAWVFAGRAFRWDGESLSEDEELTSLGVNDVRDVHGGDDGALWISTSAGSIYRHDDDGWVRVEAPWEDAQQYLHVELWALGPSSLFVALDDGALWRFEDGTWTQLTAALGGRSHTELWVASGGVVWLRWDAWLLRWDGARLVEEYEVPAMAAGAWLDYELSVAGPDDVWLYVDGMIPCSGDLLRWRDGEWTLVQEDRPSPRLALAEHETGVVGTGVLGRVASWTGARELLHFSSLQTHDAVFARAADDVWVSEVTGVARFDGTEWARFPAVPGSAALTVWGARDGSLWAGGWLEGIETPYLARLDDGQWEHAPVADLVAGPVMSIVGRGPADVYAATAGAPARVLRFDGVSWSLDSTLSQAASPRLWVVDDELFLTPFESGRPWFADAQRPGTNGVHRRTSAGWEQVTPQLTVRSVHVTDDGGLEVVGEGSTLYRPPLPWP